MLLDLTGNTSLPSEVARILDEVAARDRPAFIDFIDSLSAVYGDKIDWWVMSVASRNVYSSTLFHQCCLVQLVRELLVRKLPITEIVVSRRALYRVLKRILVDGHHVVRLRLQRQTWDVIALGFRPFYNYSAAIYRHAAQWVCARFFKPKVLPARTQKIVLVGTFVYSNSFVGAYRDRHYPGMLDMLEASERQRIFLLPTLYKVRNYLSVIRRLRLSDVQFIMKEDYLHISDYVSAFLHVFRSQRFWRQSCIYDGLEISEIYNADLYHSMGRSSTVDGLLKYRLAKRMREAGIEAGCFVDWFENQEINHGINAGFRKWYPEARCIGYQGFVASPFYLSMFPTREEYRRAVIPNEIAVIGEGYVDKVREFCPQLDVTVAPAFRYAYLWQPKRNARLTGRFTVVVTLPMSKKESVHLIRMMRHILTQIREAERASDGALSMVFKMHPAVPMETLLEELGCHDLTKADFISGNMAETLEIADVVVSAASGTCMEAVTYGVPVLVIAGGIDPTFNPIPEEIDPILWRVCYAPDEILININDLRSRSRGDFEGLAGYIRNRYFSPVTADSVRAFLCLNEHPV